MAADPSTSYRAQAEAWIADDPDPHTQETLRGLLADETALEALFRVPLAFGTAGLRGRLGPGPARMNRRVVAQTTRGLCDYLCGLCDDARARGLCVARDARHGSDAFFDEVLQIALGAGFVVHAFDEVAPTPILAFAVRQLDAMAGVMVTASHNPKQDNGYKVFLDGGAQLVAPHDRGIALAKAKITAVRSLPRQSLAAGRASGALRFCDAAMETQYRQGLREHLGQGESRDLSRDLRDLRIAYSPLHGVAGRMAKAVLTEAGCSQLHVVASQAAPDPDFPTLTFPNPEEPGTTDALLALAADVDADVALANDPDGDRLAVGVRDGTGRFELLSGNQVGCLLADYALERDRQTHPANASAPAPLVCSTIVSSPMLDAIARGYGARVERTLTGFKWMFARVAELEPEGHRFVFGFEDAMGYAATPLVRDKDGLSAAVLIAQLAAACKRNGGSLGSRLQGLFDRHGVHDSALHTVTTQGTEGKRVLRERMAALRAAPPDRLGEAQVVSISDYLTGVRHAAGETTPLSLPKSDVLVIELTDGARLCVRPSGTEPKLKLYLDVCTWPTAQETRLETRARAKRRMRQLVASAESLVGE